MPMWSPPHQKCGMRSNLFIPLVSVPNRLLIEFSFCWWAIIMTCVGIGTFYRIDIMGVVNSIEFLFTVTVCKQNHNYIAKWWAVSLMNSTSHKDVYFVYTYSCLVLKNIMFVSSHSVSARDQHIVWIQCTLRRASMVTLKRDVILHTLISSMTNNATVHVCCVCQAQHNVPPCSISLQPILKQQVSSISSVLN